MTVLLVVLQNTYEHRTNSPEWEAVFWDSYTGKRLKEMLPVGVECVVTNASTMIGYGSKSVCPADVDHIQWMVEQVKPSAILACGIIAQRGLASAGYEFISAPHPAWRQLSKIKTREIRLRLQHLIGATGD